MARLLLAIALLAASALAQGDPPPFPYPNNYDICPKRQLRANHFDGTQYPLYAVQWPYFEQNFGIFVLGTAPSQNLTDPLTGDHIEVAELNSPPVTTLLGAKMNKKGHDTGMIIFSWIGASAYELQVKFSKIQMPRFLGLDGWRKGQQKADVPDIGRTMLATLQVPYPRVHDEHFIGRLRWQKDWKVSPSYDIFPRDDPNYKYHTWLLCNYDLPSSNSTLLSWGYALKGSTPPAACIEIKSVTADCTEATSRQW